MSEFSITNRIKGTLIGCAFGDAMGMPTEMLSRVTIDELFPEGISTFEPSTQKDFIGRHFPAGEVTDDTINTLLVCDTIIENHGKFITEKYISMLQDWIAENASINPYIMGPNTTKALTAIKNGTPVHLAGRFGTTNGSAMKVSPIGIISDYNDLPSLADNVEKLCLPTHNTNIAISGACAIAACVSYGVRGSHNIEEMWKIAFMASKEGVKRGNSVPCVSLQKRMTAVKELVDKSDEGTVVAQLQNFYGTGMETIETVPTVLAVVTLSNGIPSLAAKISANLSGDSDTIGAISTAICGSMNPVYDEKDVQLLEKVNHIDFDQYAEKLSPFVK